jgi:hypothetical protein
MPELTLEPDLTGGEKQKKNITKSIILKGEIANLSNFHTIAIDKIC